MVAYNLEADEQNPVNVEDVGLASHGHQAKSSPIAEHESEVDHALQNEIFVPLSQLDLGSGETEVPETSTVPEKPIAPPITTTPIQLVTQADEGVKDNSEESAVGNTASTETDEATLARGGNSEALDPHAHNESQSREESTSIASSTTPSANTMSFEPVSADIQISSTNGIIQDPMTRDQLSQETNEDTPHQ
ncbi:uncharacterized protein I303_105319 [Kwoniella dejecticola CBS 10117]|uniref:Uncharacterized protein n=1 Tax=Kwoniella dejecticola CBS 10117 TaxID=1296121 RepID=A0A1A6A2V2_9TREE|nr:uncharacterized protein I303_05234 [Kwoniella dejecticola CBS 10117]OBR84376.1 hypothetical protein I303_05234 [Kwoniella dejecticola CBS 10117]